MKGPAEAGEICSVEVEEKYAARAARLNHAHGSRWHRPLDVPMGQSAGMRRNGHRRQGRAQWYGVARGLNFKFQTDISRVCRRP
jgi:hypothetical protein